MKKKILILFVIIAAIVVSLFVYDETHVSKKEYAELVRNHPIQKRLKLTKKERKKLGIPPNRYFDDQYLLEMNPRTGRTNPENLLKVKKNKIKSTTRFSAVPGQNSEMAWEERGPNNIGGRTRVVFYDPNDTTGKRVFAGGVTGGLWVNNNIEDENSLWSQIGIDENLAISCYAIDPNDSNTWYVGTGEVYTGDDGTGNGIWITKDGGVTWSQLFSIDLDRDSENRRYFISQILAWDNGGTTEIYYSADGAFDIDPVGIQPIGWWKQQGGSFSRIRFLTPDSTPSPYVFSDVEIANDNSIWVGTKQNIFGDGGGKIFRSTDGINFTEKYSFSSGRRVELAVSKQQANTIYALAETNNSSNVELIKTTNGSSFVSISKPNDVDVDIPANDFARGQGFYNLTLEVDPNNDNILYAGGIDLFRSSNGGDSWSQISKWSKNGSLRGLNVSLVHADQHAVVFDPNNSNKALFANDGGIYYANNLSAANNSAIAIASRNKNYNITQFYSGAISQDKDNELLLGGTQDNGSQFSFKANAGVNSFTDIFGGDGIQNFIDKDGKYLIVSFTHNVYSTYSLPLDDSANLVSIEEDQSSGSFANVADLDDELDILYTDGSLGSSERISRYTDLLGSPTRRNFTSPKLFERPTAIKVSPFTTNSSTVFIGTEGSSVLKVTNFNTNNPIWTNIDLDNEIDTGAISDIDFGANENEILVTLHNYGVTSIYYTEDGGVNWQNKEGDFPDIPVKAIKMNPIGKREVIIGTNMGIWQTNNFESKFPTWKQSFNGMSSVRVTKFDMRTSDNTVLAATYGRGLFTGAFTKGEFELAIEEPVSIFGTIVNNGKISFNVRNKSLSTYKVAIYSISGIKMLEKELQTNLSDNSVDVSQFSPGIYILNFIVGSRQYSKKIIIKN